MVEHLGLPALPPVRAKHEEPTRKTKTMTTNASNVATRSAASGALAALGGLKQGLSNVKAAIPTAGGEPILRMGRDGIWLYGGDNIEVEEGSLWAVNPLSLKHGWVCWKKVPEGSREKPEKYGDILVPMQEPKPALASLPTYADGEWSEQTCIVLRCTNGTDEGTQVEYKPSSIGGGNAMRDLIEAIMKQLDTDPARPVPVVSLESDSYQHKTYGKTYTPVLHIDHWVSMDGLDGDAGSPEPEQETAPEPAAEPSEAANGRRRGERPAAQAPEPEAPAEQETAPAQGQGEVRRRRR